MPMDQVLNPTLMRLAEIEARLTRLETRHMSDTFGLSAQETPMTTETTSLHERLTRASRSTYTNEFNNTTTYYGVHHSDCAAIEQAIRAAPPVLVPAIREALVREMIADYKSAVETYGEEDAINPETWIRSFLPAYWAEDQNAGEGWRHVVYIDGPTGQLSWHVSDADFKAVIPRLRKVEGKPWDGHGAEEKYRRLASIPDHTFPRAENAALKIRNEKLKDQIVDLVAEAEVMREEAREWNDENDALRAENAALRTAGMELRDEAFRIADEYYVGELAGPALDDAIRSYDAATTPERTGATR